MLQRMRLLVLIIKLLTYMELETMLDRIPDNKKDMAYNCVMSILKNFI